MESLREMADKYSFKKPTDDLIEVIMRFKYRNNERLTIKSQDRKEEIMNELQKCISDKDVP